MRTVQRYESGNGLPIHRPTRKRRGPVIAIAAELERWVKAGSGELAQEPRKQVNVSQEIFELRELLSEMRQSRVNLEATLQKLNESVTALHKTQQSPLLPPPWYTHRIQ